MPWLSPFKDLTVLNSLVPTSGNRSSSVAQLDLCEHYFTESSCHLTNQGQGRLNDEGYGEEQRSIASDTAVPSHWQVPKKWNIAQFPESKLLYPQVSDLLVNHKGKWHHFLNNPLDSWNVIYWNINRWTYWSWTRNKRAVRQPQLLCTQAEQNNC